MRNSLGTSLPQPLLRWSSLWHSVIRPVVHHNIMLRNRVPSRSLPECDHATGLLVAGGASGALLELVRLLLESVRLLLELVRRCWWQDTCCRLSMTHQADVHMHSRISCSSCVFPGAPHTACG